MPTYAPADETVGFDWDAGNRAKCQKHGVPIAEIELLLRASPRIAPDLKHSAIEDRYVAIGRDSNQRAMFVVFTMRIKDGLRLIRPITARYMHRKEIAGYEAEGSEVQDR